MLLIRSPGYFGGLDEHHLFLILFDASGMSKCNLDKIKAISGFCILPRDDLDCLMITSHSRS